MKNKIARLRTKKALAPLAIQPLGDPHTAIRNAHITLNVAFVEYGDQIDLYVDGKLVTSGCQDYGDNYRIKDLKADFLEELVKAVQRFSKGR